MLKRRELDKRIKAYLQEYRRGYECTFGIDELDDDIDIITFIKSYYRDVYSNPREGENAFFQIFSAIDALDEKDPYLKTMQEIESEFGLDRDIIEVGGGMFPSLARLIAKRQSEIGKGTITVYDPELVTQDLPGITLIRKNFTVNTPIPKNALIIGRKPCQATETMIKVAGANNSEVYLNLCKCNHLPKINTMLEANIKKEIWISYINKLALDVFSNNFRVENSTFLDPLVNVEETIVKVKKIKK